MLFKGGHERVIRGMTWAALATFASRFLKHV